LSAPGWHWRLVRQCSTAWTAIVVWGATCRLVRQCSTAWAALVALGAFGDLSASAARAGESPVLTGVWGAVCLRRYGKSQSNSKTPPHRQQLPFFAIQGPFSEAPPNVLFAAIAASPCVCAKSAPTRPQFPQPRAAPLSLYTTRYAFDPEGRLTIAQRFIAGSEIGRNIRASRRDARTPHSAPRFQPSLRVKTVSTRVRQQASRPLSLAIGPAVMIDSRGTGVVASGWREVDGGN
jgi:hypothetical protein